MFTKHEVNVLINKKMKKAFKGKKRRKQKLRTFEKMDDSEFNESM